MARCRTVGGTKVSSLERDTALIGFRDKALSNTHSVNPFTLPPPRAGVKADRSIRFRVQDF